MNSTEIGVKTEGIILSSLLKMGKQVLVPFGHGCRYDIAYEENGQLIRVQCKTARYQPDKGRIIFNTCSLGRKNDARSYDDDADLFGLYCPQLDKIYLVPVDIVAKGKGSLRIDPVRNGQKSMVVMASDFEI